MTSPPLTQENRGKDNIFLAFVLDKHKDIPCSTKEQSLYLHPMD